MTSRFGEIKQLHLLRNNGASDARAFYVSAVFKNLNSLFPEDNMPAHALTFSLKTPPKCFRLSY